MGGTIPKYNFIDLFAGAGGLSEGFIQAGFLPLAHVEMNPFAAKTLETRIGYYFLKGQKRLTVYYDYLKGKISREQFLSNIPEQYLRTVLCETMSDETLPNLFSTIDFLLKEKKLTSVDVIIGGPPCQAYSLVGRAQSSHMETPMEDDPRNGLGLVRCFLRILLGFLYRIVIRRLVLFFTRGDYLVYLPVSLLRCSRHTSGRVMRLRSLHALFFLDFFHSEPP